MEQQAQFRQYVHDVAEWGKKLQEQQMGYEIDGLETLLSRLQAHEGEWREEEIEDIQMMVEAIYETAVRILGQDVQEDGQSPVSLSDQAEQQALFQQYVHKVRDWGTSLAESGREGDVERLLAYLEQHEGEWSEEEMASLEAMVEAIDSQAARPAQWARDGEQAEERQPGQGRVPIGKHALPPLPYRYDALEPHISEEIMRLHHTKHHQSYVDGLNKAEQMMQKARQTNDFSLLKHWEREAAFHGSGHYLHTIFWHNMTPNGGGRPQGALLQQIRDDFGSFERFQQHFTEAAKSAEGVGWALLVWSPRAQRLEILQAEKHQHMTQWDTIPLLVLDVWEHAYYLQYKNDRAAYIRSFWNVVNWRDVEQRFEQASKLRWQPF